MLDFLIDLSGCRQKGLFLLAQALLFPGDV
jgi:hypothetical protein